MIYSKYGPLLSGNKIACNDAIALKRLVTDNSTAIYSRPINKELFESAMLPPLKLAQLELALSSDRLCDLLTGERRNFTSVELNGILQSVRECGLNEEVARTLLDELLYSIGVITSVSSHAELNRMCSNTKSSASGKSSEAEFSQYIPHQLTYETFERVRSAIKANMPEAMTPELLGRLELYDKCGVGQASFLIFCLFDKGIGVPKDRLIADNYLNRAAELGYPPASGMLADRAFERGDYDAAYALYVKPGAIALDSTRRERVERLLSAKQWFGKIRFVLFGLCAVLLATLFATFSLFGESSDLAWLVICSLAIVAATTTASVVHIKNPMLDIRFFGMLMAFPFTLCLTAILL